ncbi:putative peptide export ATP-binding protein YydI [Melissococcus plutonius]|nr:putative peptide export ATP-binding protein YydI [Melissococcus plutonius S1]KMT24633.1 putative peptide export ATP-binding protein YydI [Melissococcus plutonius]KMT27346.1 putative peptide export ATP-binding protein YydI [Melissococcus plutonius]KMT27519.1 putative peptide export ATP-binding protein YydI [Melissococcus plutonius]KMT29293.1 putative peptide export ATP-binding protein YydI [Melissococcus plutonius]
MFIDHFYLKVGNKLLLKDTTLPFSEGKINHVLGQNGVGKSQLAKEFILNRSKLIPKNIIEYTIILSSFSNVPSELTLSDLQLLKNRLSDEIYKLLNLASIDSKIKIKDLSDGQKQKIKLYLFFSSNKNIVILDEITNAIDKKTVLELYDFLNLYRKQNPQKTIINITHNLSDLKHLQGNYFLSMNIN